MYKFNAMEADMGPRRYLGIDEMFEEDLKRKRMEENEKKDKRLSPVENSIPYGDVAFADAEQNDFFYKILESYPDYFKVFHEMGFNTMQAMEKIKEERFLEAFMQARNMKHVQLKQEQYKMALKKGDTRMSQFLIKSFDEESRNSKKIKHDELKKDRQRKTAQELEIPYYLRSDVASAQNALSSELSSLGDDKKL